MRGRSASGPGQGLRHGRKALVPQNDTGQFAGNQGIRRAATTRQYLTADAQGRRLHFMAISVQVREEVHFIQALCGVYARARLTPKHFFLPNGNPDQHRLDATVMAMEANRQRPVAIELTKCFQGGKVGRSSPAQNEVEAWRRLEERIAATLRGAPAVAARCVECRIWLVEAIGEILEIFRAPRTKEHRTDVFTESLVELLVVPLHEALHESLRTKRAEKASLPPELAGIVAHAQVNAYADRSRLGGWPPATPGVYVELKGLVSVGQSGQQVDTILPRWVGIDSKGIIDAVKAKLEAIPAYKAIARDCGAEELWLVAVADGASQVSMVATPVLMGVKDGIRKLHDRTLAKGRPFFDRVILLAAGYWAPGDLRDLDAVRAVGMTFMPFDLHG